MAKKRAFFSFDFDEDQNLKHHMVGQMKLPTSPFEGADWSMKEAAPQRNWEHEAEARISRSNVVVVLVGPKTPQGAWRAQGSLRLHAAWANQSFKSSVTRTAARWRYRTRGGCCDGPGTT